MSRNRLVWLGLVIAVACGSGLPGRASGDEPAQAEKRPAEGYQSQDLDDPAAPLVPLKPRTADEQARLDAAAWYMTGRLREGRNDFSGALEAYKKAVELNPRAVEIYQSLVPLAFSLNQTKEAVDYAMKAVELDPDDYMLLRRLGVHMATERKIPEAVQLLERATKSPRLEKESANYVTLMRDLAILYGAIGETEKTADAYEVVFDALTNSSKYGLDFRTKAALLADPSTTYERIGQSFLEAERTELAVKAFEEAAKTAKGKPGVLSYNLARVYVQTKKFEEALTELQKYFDAQLQSKGREAYELLAKILEETKKSDELIGRLEKLAAADPRNSTLQYFLAEKYLAADRLEDAEKLYKKTLEGSSDPEGYVGLAGVYRRLGKPEQLLENLSKAISAGGNLDEIEARLEMLGTEMEAIGQDEKLRDSLIEAGRKLAEDDGKQLDAAGSLILAKLAASAKKTDDVVAFYRHALKRRRDRASIIYEELGEYLLTAEEYEQAAKVYREAADAPALAQARPNFLFRLSQAQSFMNDHEGALTSVQEARKTLPDHPLLHYQEAWIHYHARDWEKAIPLFEQVITKYPQHSEIVRRSQFSLSNVYVQKGDIRKGEEILEKILEQDPDDPSVNNDLGYLYADQGKNLEKAEKMIRKAVEAEPENAAYLDSMGWVLYKLGKYDEAVPYLEKAVKLPSGSDATLYDHLGDAYHRLEKADKAREAWETALDHAKKSTTPDQKLIERLEQKLKDPAGALKPEGKGTP